MFNPLDETRYMCKAQGMPVRTRELIRAGL